MNHRTITTFVVGLGLVLLDASSTAQVSAWWVTARFSPRAMEVKHIPVRELRPNWKRASPLSEADLPVEAGRPGDGLRDQGFAFSVNGDFDGQGT